jgi:hypothetical protein
LFVGFIGLSWFHEQFEQYRAPVFSADLFRRRALFA